MKEIEITDLFTKKLISKIIVFPSDDEKMIQKRIASELKSIPEYIFIYKVEDILTSETTYVFDMFNFIKNISTSTFSNIYDKNVEDEDEEGEDEEGEDSIDGKIIFSLLNKFNILDIFIIFLVYNTELEDAYTHINDAYYTISETLNDFKEIVLNDFKENPLNISIEFNENELLDKWKNRNFVKLNFKEKINKNKKFVLKDDKLKAEFNSIEPLEYDEFKIEKNRIFVKIQNMPNSILEFFNDIQLNSDIPFASYKDFYKILNGFKPNKTLTVSDNLQLELIINENYIQIFLNSKGELTFDCPITLSYDDIIDKIKSINLNLDLSEPDTVGLNGSFSYNNIINQMKKPYNKYVLSDLIMNDEIFSNYMTLSELEKTQKKRFFVYFHDEDNKISSEFSLVDKHLKISVIKCKNLKNIVKFQEILSRLLVIYSKNYDSIIEYYVPYVDLTKYESTEVTKQIKNRAPAIFFSSEANCTNNGKPTLIKSEEEYNDALDNDKQIMLFPKKLSKKDYDNIIKNNEIPLNFLIDHENENKKIYRFVCNDEKHKYPGVKISKNNSDVPLFPCCYETDQTNKKSKLKYLPYFDIINKTNKHKFNYEENVDVEGEVEGEVEGVVEEQKKKNLKLKKIKKGNGILSNGDYGNLPTELNTFFSEIDTNTKHSYVRKGVEKGINSFIQCIVECIEEEEIKYINLLEDEEDRNKRYLRTDYQDVRYELLQFLPVCKQECYIENIDEIIRNNSEYFDPIKFIRLLEYKYDVNIFIFHRDRESTKETMILPNHQNQYYKFLNKKKCIFIYEHYGTSRAASKEKIPQCEIIMRIDETDDKNYEYMFDFSSDIVTNILNIYNHLDNIIYYEDKERIFREKNTGEIFLKNNRVISQVVDIFGKTRVIIIEIDHKKYAINIVPIPPLNVPIINIEESRQYNLSETHNYDNRIGIMNIEYIKNTITGTMGEFNVYMEYKEDHKIKEYNKMKKISRCIVNHFIWLYSTYVNEMVDPDNRTYDDLTNDDFSEFIDMEYIEIDPSFNYEIIRNELSKENDGIFRDEKLIIKSEETLNRLKYVLKHKIVREFGNVIEYHTKTNMSDYYMDIDDFDSYPFQTILKGKEFTEKWLNASIQDYELFDSIELKKTTQYFFRNQLIDDRTYIAHNVDTIEKAINIGIFWNIEEYNPNQIKNFDYENYGYKILLYAYKNSKDIEKYTIEKNERKNAGILKIIGYKIKKDDNFIDRFTVLLEM